MYGSTCNLVSGSVFEHIFIVTFCSKLQATEQAYTFRPGSMWLINAHEILHVNTRSFQNVRVSSGPSVTSCSLHSLGTMTHTWAGLTDLTLWT